MEYQFYSQWKPLWVNICSTNRAQVRRVVYYFSIFSFSLSFNFIFSIMMDRVSLTNFKVCPTSYLCGSFGPLFGLNQSQCLTRLKREDQKCSAINSGHYICLAPLSATHQGCVNKPFEPICFMVNIRDKTTNIQLISEQVHSSQSDYKR